MMARKEQERMSTDADSHAIRECTTKEEVLAYYFHRLNEIEKSAQQGYAIEAVEFTEMFEHEFFYERCCAATTTTAASVSAMTTSKPMTTTASEATTTPISFAHSKRNGTQKISHFSISHSYDKCSKKHYASKSGGGNNKDKSNGNSQLRRCARYLAWLAICLILVNYRIELTKLFMRNVQAYIHPGMRFWRMLTLPVIQQFPELTYLYDETCLVSNPLFRVTNLDCSPCADVINVVDLSIAAATAPSHFGYLGNNIPHIIQQVDNVNHSIADIYQLYRRNREIFRDEAYKVRSTDPNVVNLDQLFDVMLNKSGKVGRRSSHSLWRINRMTPARIVRTLFPTPQTVPKHAGIDIERFIAFDVTGDDDDGSDSGDGDATTYQLPSTDCSNMFVYQAIGSRVIHLQPTSECRQQCRRLTVKLKQNHTLFYDWWYWKPISSPADQLLKTTSVSYIGSYC